MEEVNVKKLYNFYEIFNDFNRIRILICLSKKEKTVEEISAETDLRLPIISNQLDYLYNCGIIFKIENEEENKITFKINDKTMVRIVENIIKYINKM